MGSPLLAVRQTLSAGNPLNSWLIGVGPVSRVPALSYTEKTVLTICTYWVGPTAPLGSGGSHRQPAAEPPAESTELCPSKVPLGVGAAGAASVVCTAFCTAWSTKPAGTGRFGFTRSRPCSTSRGPVGAAVDMSRTAGETPL